jgi:fatty acid desaturase
MVMEREPASRTLARDRRRPEWPTFLVLAGLYGAFGLLTWFHDVLPWWLLLVLGGYTVCLHGSLQHEAVHGHPTSRAWVNEALVFPSLWLWMPYRVYRETHLTHHRNEQLTDPVQDPESYYVTPERWAALGPLSRGILWACNTLLGRLVLGPLAAVWRLYAGAARRLATGDLTDLGAWALHVAGSALVLGWVVGVCAMPILDYAAFFAYPGLSLTLLRSFLEHRAREVPAERSVVVEAGPVMSLMFLNNNLHALHHAEPTLAWYRLPARYRARRARLLADNGAYRYSGYWEIAARYLLWPKEPPAHPCHHAPAFLRLRGDDRASAVPSQSIL